MSSKNRPLRSLHFEQPFSVGSGGDAGGDPPVVGAIVTGPLGALVHRAFSMAFMSVLRARDAVATKPTPSPKPAKKKSAAAKTLARKPRRRRRGGRSAE